MPSSSPTTVLTNPQPPTPPVAARQPAIKLPVPQDTRTFRYEVETDQGTYQLELDAAVPEGPAGQRMLEELLAEQLQSNRQNYPITAAIHDIGKGVIGGIRDAAQDIINTPVDIANTISEFVSPDPPGGPRRRMVPEITSPQLPDKGEPENRTERIARLLTRITADLVPIGSVAAKATKGIRAARKALHLDPLQRRMLHAMSGASDVRHLNRGKVVRLLEDLGDLKKTNPDAIVDTNLEAVRRAARRRLDKLDGVDTRYLQDLTDDLQEAARGTENVAESANTLSESARRISRVFDLPFRPEDYAKMAHEQALQAQRRLLSRLPDVEIERQGGRFSNSCV